jgi:acetolactate synthase I/II/III large subunit
MQELIRRYLDHGLGRRAFFQRMAGMGFTLAAAKAFLAPLDASERAELSPAGSTIEGTGGELVVAQAKAAGAEYLFSNPGSFEVGFYDAFTDTPGMQIIMGLHEGVVVSMADGYHRVSRKPAFVNVHVVAGTAQMAGQLYNASRDGSALVITAGLLDNELWGDDVVLAPRPGFTQKEIVRQFTKISWEVRNGESLPLILRRAFKVATTEPGGPVYMAMADYALESKGVKAQILPADRFLLRAHVRPSASAIDDAARMLVASKRPLLVVGDEVWKGGAQAELLQFSEKFGLPVALGTAAFRSFPVKHPLYLGAYNLDSEYVKRGVDLALVIGAPDFGGRTFVTSPIRSIEPPGSRIVRIGIDTAAMGRTSPTDLALVGDIKETLADLRTALESLLTKARLASFGSARMEEVRTLTSAARAKSDAEIRQNFGRHPIHPDELGAVLARTIDPNAIVVSENLTGKYDAFPFGFRDNEPMWMGNTGASLGWGIGAATGAKLGAPDRQVICSIGDGSVMYSSSGFWTQVRYGIPVLTVVWNNHNYQTVRHAYDNYKGKMHKSGHYAGMYLGDPNIDFVKLAESQGVKGECVTAGVDLEAALKRGIAATRDGKPYLVEVVISRYGGGADSTWYEKFNLAEKRNRRV